MTSKENIFFNLFYEEDLLNNTVLNIQNFMALCALCIRKKRHFYRNHPLKQGVVTVV